MAAIISLMVFSGEWPVKPRLGALIATVLTLAMLTGIGAVLKVRARPVGTDALEIQPPKLPELQVGEERPFHVAVENKCPGTLRLAAPGGNCGCVAAQREPFDLAGGETKTLQFRLRAPNRPGPIRKEIVLKLRDNPDVAWTVPVTAEVIARVWAEPAWLQLDYDSPTTLDAKVLLHLAAHLPVDKITLDNRCVAVKRHLQGPETEVIDVAVKAGGKDGAEKGAAHAQVWLRGDTAPALTVPIAWSRRPPVRCLPQEINLGAISALPPVFSHRLIVLCKAGTEAKDLTAAPLVPWLRVKSRTPLPSGLSLQLEILREEMPDQIDEPVLRLRCAKSGDTLDVIGRANP